jgi:hypothetical protein
MARPSSAMTEESCDSRKSGFKLSALQLSHSNLWNLRNTVISPSHCSNRGRICMISITSQPAPSRPKLMLDARWAC